MYQLPDLLHSLLRAPAHAILRRPVEDKLAWVDKIQLGREYVLGRKCPDRVRNYYRHRFTHGGMLARLRRSKTPPTLRTTDRAPAKALLAVEQDEL